MQQLHPWGKVFDLSKITLRVPHIVSVKHFNASTLSGLGAYFDFRILIADTTSSFVITQSVGCLLLHGFHLLPDHVWLYLVLYRTVGWVVENWPES